MIVLSFHNESKGVHFLRLLLLRLVASMFYLNKGLDLFEQGGVVREYRAQHLVVLELLLIVIALLSRVIVLQGHLELLVGLFAKLFANLN